MAPVAGLYGEQSMDTAAIEAAIEPAASHPSSAWARLPEARLSPANNSRAELGTYVDTMTVVTVVSALVIGSSLIMAVVICGCCGKKKDEQVVAMGGGGGEWTMYYSTDPGSSNYCAECAAAAAAGDKPTEIAAGTQISASKGFGPSMHRYTHRTEVGGGGGGSPRGSVQTVGTVAPTVTSYKSQKSGSLPKYQSMGGGPTNISEAPRKGAAGAIPPSDTQMSKAAANPAYQTLFDAKSGVFDQGGGRQKGALTTQQLGTKSAANPAYQTLFGAQSDIFAKQGGGPAQSKVGKSVRPPEQSHGYRA